MMDLTEADGTPGYAFPLTQAANGCSWPDSGASTLAACWETEIGDTLGSGTCPSWPGNHTRRSLRARGAGGLDCMHANARGSR